MALVVGRLASEIDPEKINSGSGDEFQIQLFVQGAASQTVYMNWTQARQFYQERLTLADFLEKLEREVSLASSYMPSLVLVEALQCFSRWLLTEGLHGWPGESSFPD